jgi:hypothetical protein
MPFDVLLPRGHEAAYGAGKIVVDIIGQTTLCSSTFHMPGSMAKWFGLSKRRAWNHFDQHRYISPTVLGQLPMLICVRIFGLNGRRVGGCRRGIEATLEGSRKQ